MKIHEGNFGISGAYLDNKLKQPLLDGISDDENDQ
jgi:hypothetical protein